ncbi:MAG: hypothetical protein Q4D14_00295 [Bacteroidales bacterium]|nr:hypothetical protein [Bacteroidales bacterium]
MKKIVLSALLVCATIFGFTSCGQEPEVYDGVETNFAGGEYFGDLLGTGSYNFVLRFESKDYAADSVVRSGAYYVLDLSSESNKNLLPKEGTYTIVKNFNYAAGTITYGTAEHLEEGMGSYGYSATTGLGYLFDSGTVTISKSGDTFTIDAVIYSGTTLVKFRYEGALLFQDKSESSVSANGVQRHVDVLDLNKVVSLISK